MDSTKEYQVNEFLSRKLEDEKTNRIDLLVHWYARIFNRVRPVFE